MNTRMEIGGFFMIGVSRLVQVFAKCFLKIASDVRLPDRRASGEPSERLLSVLCVTASPGEKIFFPSSPKAVSHSSFSHAHPNSPNPTPFPIVSPSPDLLPPPANASPRQQYTL